MFKHSKEEMSKIWFTSDTHFGHNKDFLYEPRNFKNIYDHDDYIVKAWNALVQPDDIVYHLGDLMLGDNEYGCEKFKQLNGKFHIILGNHDTETRVELYHNLLSVRSIQYSAMLKCGKQHYYLSHYPSFTANYDDSPYHSHLINLFGHTHQKEKFFNDNPFMFHVGLDSNGNLPVNLETVDKLIHNKINELYKEKMQHKKEIKEYYDNGLGYFERHAAAGEEILN